MNDDRPFTEDSSTSGSALDVLQDNAEAVAGMLRVLAHRDRLLMLCRMSEGEVSVGQLVEMTGLAQSSVSQHLAVLREAGAVQVRPEAQTRLYSIADPHVAAILNALCAAYGPPPGKRAAA